MSAAALTLVPPFATQKEALALVEELAGSDELRMDYDLEPGAFCPDFAALPASLQPSTASRPQLAGTDLL